MFHVNRITTALVALGAMVLVGCTSSATKSSGGANIGAQVKPTPPMMAMAANPTPPANATKTAASIGEGKLAVNTANSPDDVDYIWAAKIDIDGDGEVDDTQILYDDEDGVLYFYANDNVPCKDGGMASAGLLIAMNCKGNPRGRAVGSGWCALFLDASECGAETAGIYGYRFDATGTPTAWASITLDEKNDDIVFVAMQK